MRASFLRPLTLAAAVAAAAPAQTDEAFARDVAPVLRRTCVACHAGPRAKGELDLAVAASRPSSLDGATWGRVRDRVLAKEMPPEEAPAPTDAERATLVAWIAARSRGDARPLDPGRPAPRRLSRVEYANAIRDLFGVAVRAEDELPADDVAYGFDNGGDGRPLSPAAFEAYVAAAERVAAEAIMDEDPDRPPARRAAAEAMDCDLKPSSRDGFRILFSAGSVTTKVSLPRDGRFVLRAHAYGDQAGPEPARLAFTVDGRVVATVDVRATRAAPATFETTVELKKGARTVGAAFANDYFDPKHKDPAQRDRNLAVAWFECAGPVDRREPPPAHRRLFAGDDARKPPKDRAARLLGPLLLRAYRRPGRIDEVDRLATAVADAVRRGARFEGGLRVALAAVLASPAFLLRIEKDPPGSGPVRDLDGYEIATRLAFYLWSAPPDERLLERAASGALKDADAVVAEAGRLLDDARATALAENFAVQWWELRELAAAAPDPVRFPAFDEPLRAALRREAELLFETVLRERRPARELLDADFTFVNERLAAHYGFVPVVGPEFRRVNVPDRRRGGIVGLAGVHLVTSNPTRTSPVKRGKWVLDHLLDAPPSAPPPGVGALEEDAAGTTAATLRERMERHRRDPSCATCHTRMDALGFALENFDAVGAWRDAEDGRPVDASGALPGGRAVRGPAELKALLRGDDAFLRALLKKLLVFAVGRGLGPDDAIAVERLAAALGPEPTLRDAVLGVVRLDAFRQRRTTPRRRRARR